ncbi:MAG: hypothetical protein ACYDDF_04830 [Thermoplasmatota archaeon]
MAPWQDALLSLVALVFLASLVPSVLKRGTQVSRATSVPTAAGAWVQAVTLITLGLVVSGGITLIIAAAWTAIAVTRPIRT